MVEAKNLMIGNKFRGIAGIQTVFEISDNTDRGRFDQKGYEHLILVEENRNQYKPIEIDGIEITPEILTEWCGFWMQFDGKLVHLGEKGFAIYFFDGSVHIAIDDSFGAKTKRLDIKFLHQLQNLCAILGRELKVEIKKTHGAH